MAQRSDRTVQVVMSWGGNPQRELSVRAGGRVVIGEGSAAFPLPGELGLSRFDLIESDGAGGFVLRVPAGATLRAARGGLDVSAEASGDPAGTRTLALDPALRAEVELGSFTFFVQEGATALDKPPLARPDFRSWRWAGVSLLVHGAFLFSLLFAPPDAGALSLDLTREQREWVNVRLDAVARERAVTMPEPAPADDAAGGAAGQPSPGEEGVAGAPDETRSTGGGMRVRGDRDDRRVPLDRTTAATAGALGTITSFIHSMSAVTSPYGAADALGFSRDDAYGPLTATDPGFLRGLGGLGMNGVGRGGGCQPGQPCGQGTIGVGGLGTGGTCGIEVFRRIEVTEGREAAIAQCMHGHQGFGGVGTGVAMNPRRPGRVPPRMACAPGPDGQCAAVAAGGLSREQVRLVVTRNRGQVRHCYERALQQRPDLAGRLSVAWTVHPEGRVMSASVSGSNDLQNADIERCVVQAVRRWQFPATSGATAVTYPFVFQTQ